MIYGDMDGYSNIDNIASGNFIFHFGNWTFTSFYGSGRMW